MKRNLLKSLLAITLLLGGVSFSWGEETIGNVDEGWSEHYKTYPLAPGKSLTINFTVDETKKTADYQGWMTKVRVGTSETMVFFAQCSGGYWSADGSGNWTWWTGATYAANNYDWTETDGNHENLWNNFQGASVVYNIKRVGNDIILSEDVTTTSSAPSASTKFRHYFVFPYESSEDFSIDFGADAAVLTIKEVTTTDATTPTYGTLVGSSNNTTGWWTAFSDYYSVAANETKTVYFRNYSNKLQNYFNWLIGLTNDVDRGGEGYTEHVVLRADNYLIQNPHSGTLTSNYNWSTFKDELDGALVKMNVARSGSTVTIKADQIAATDQSTVRTETYSFTDEKSASDAMRFFLTTEGGHIDILPQYTITLTRNNDSYGTTNVSTAFNDGIAPASTSVTVTATANDGYVFNGWKNGEEYVSYNSTYAFTATADVTLQAEFVAIKRTWDFTTASWAKSSGIDNSKTATINGATCYYANGHLAGLVLDDSGSNGTGWTVNGNGLTQGNGARNIGILNCAAGQLVTIQTGTTLSNPVNGTLIGTATTGTVYYQVSADGTFGFKEERNYYITSIAVTAMDYTILYAADKAVYDAKVASLDAAGQAYWTANVTTVSSVTDEYKYNTAVAALPTVYMAAVKAQITPGANMTDAAENANCETVVDWGAVTAWSSTSDQFHGNTHSTDVAQMSTPFAEAWVWTGGENSAAVLADQTISHTAISGLRAGTYRVTGFIRAFSEGSHASDTPTGFALYANEETSSTTEGITSSAGLVYGTYSVDVTIDDSEDLTFGIKVKDANFNWFAFKNFTLTLVSLAHVDVTIPSSGFGTIASAYALDCSSLPSGLTAYKVSEITNVAAKLTPVTEAVAAGTGLILEGTPSTSYEIPVVASGSDISASNKLKAAVTATAIEANTSYILQSGEFHLVTAASTIPAGKAYLLAADVPANAKALSFAFDDETGIEAIENGHMTMDNAEIYNLAGQRVNKAQKGVFIVNGKKVVVK